VLLLSHCPFIKIVRAESNLRGSMIGWVWKPTRQPRGIVPIRRNQSQRLETLALKWVITKVEIPNSAAPAVLFCSPNLGLLNGLVPPVFRLLLCTAVPYTLYNTAVKDRAILCVSVYMVYTLYLDGAVAQWNISSISALERKISVRANRDELVQKGILMPDSPTSPLPEPGESSHTF
jgi:hypothetical protein